jgi:signal peptidase I
MIERDTAPNFVASLLTAALRPRDTIRRQAGATSVLALLALWATVGVGNVLSMIGIAPINAQDWRVLLVVALIAIAWFIAILLFTTSIASFVARRLGGLGSVGAVREAYAWGAVPQAFSVFIILPMALAVQWLTGSPLAVTAGKLLIGIAGVWSLVTTIAMLMEVQDFGVVRALVSYFAATLAVVLLVALPIRLLAWQPFTIPSSSNEPTLLVGDYIFASKYSYGYSKYSFSLPTFIGGEFVPFNFSGRIFAREPKLGEVVIFRKPTDTRIDYIKRVVGLPGDEVQMRDGVLYINAKAVPQVPVEDYVESTSEGSTNRVKQFEETLPNGVTYRVLDREPHGQLDNTSLYQVPAGHYFMIGDNRDNSSDSRDPNGGVGYVPFETLVGRAEVIFMSVPQNSESRAGRLLTWVR